MRDSFHDLETFSPVPIKDGTHRYAEQAEVLLWSYALADGPVYVWDVTAGANLMPANLAAMIDDPETLIWFHNGGQFDFVVLEHAMPGAALRIPQTRRRDTMVQAYAHAMPGALAKLGEVLGLTERKDEGGRRLIHLFCKPQGDAFLKKYGTRRATRSTHPDEWRQFIGYAARDVTVMREVHRKLPKWNYSGAELELWHLDMRINNRGVAVDLPLVQAAIRASEKSKSRLATEAQDLTDGAVQAATQRDALLAHILARYGVALPDMRADTLERRLNDPELPQGVRDLIAVRLQASMNSVAKYKVFDRGVSSDGRIRGTKQFDGAGRTGRWAGRMVQLDNMPRPTMPQDMIDMGIVSLLAGAADLTHENVMSLCASAIRGCLIAPPGCKLTVADLSAIEARVTPWLAGEQALLQAFRDFDAGIGPDLYNLAYARAFNVPHDEVSKDQRQIGKCMSLFFSFGGGVNAFITGAATYGIDLDAMTEAVYPTLPGDVVEEAGGFLRWLYEPAKAAHDKRIHNLQLSVGDPDPLMEAAMLKVRHGLSEQTFIACDSLKRLWRRAHPAIVSLWKSLEDTVRLAIWTPGVTHVCRRLKVRRDGVWLRIGLPSGRALCYPWPEVADDGSISYAGVSPYSHKWGRVHTYSGKLVENVTQAVARDQFAYSMPMIEAEGYAIVLHTHDEIIAEVPDTDDFTHERLAELLCARFPWNSGLPLAAAGFTVHRYRKG